VQEVAPEPVVEKKNNNKKKSKGGKENVQEEPAAAPVAAPAPAKVEEAPKVKPPKSTAPKPKAAIGKNKFAMLMGEDSDSEDEE